MFRFFIKDIEYTDYLTESPLISSEFIEDTIIGNAVSKQLELSLDNSDDTFTEDMLNYPFEVKDDDKPLGLFYVLEKPERMTKSLYLTLYDGVYKTDIAYNSALKYPVKLKDQLEEMGTMAGLSIDYTAIDTSILNREINFYDNELSIRTHLAMIAEISACNVFASADGMGIVFRKLNTFPVHKLDDVVEKFDKIEHFKISKVMFDMGIDPIEKGDDSGNLYRLDSENMYIDSQTQVDYVYIQIKDLDIYSAQDFRTVAIDGLELGDVVEYPNYFNFIVVDLKTNYYAGIDAYNIQEISGKMKTRATEIIHEEISTDVKIKRLKVITNQNEQSLKIISQDQEGINKKLAKLEIDTEGIKQSVSNTETKIEELDVQSIHLAIIKDGTVLNDKVKSLTLKASLTQGGRDITDETSNLCFKWERKSTDINSDYEWNKKHENVKEITVTTDDVNEVASFQCVCEHISYIKASGFESITDETDIPKLNAFLDANKPDFQHYSATTGTMDPEWNPLIITPSVTDGFIPVDLSACEISWTRSDGALTEGEVQENGKLKVNRNKLSESSTKTITYLCHIRYKNIMQTIAKAFVLVIDGADGVDGKDGKDGKDGIGKDGRGIKDTAISYQESTSGTVAPTGTWVTGNVPTVKAGNFLWTRTVTTYTDNTSKTAYSVSKMGEDGKDGLKGNDGKGLDHSDVTYQSSTSGTTVPTGTWSTAIPSVPAGQFLWTRTVFTYTDKSSTTSYSVSKVGKDGLKGDTGKGIKSVTPEFYLSTSKTSQAGGSWVAACPTWRAGMYLWTRDKVVYENPTSTAYTTPKVDSSWEAVNEIQVGGRNLLLKSDTPNKDKAPNTYPCAVHSLSMNLEKGQVYTFTVNATFEKAYKCALYFGGGSYGTQWVDVNGDGTKIIKIAFTATEDMSKQSNAQFYVRDATDQPSIGEAKCTTIWVKLEKGNKVNDDWAPAPEDVNSKIDNDVANAVEQVTTAYNSAINVLKNQINLSVNEIKETIGFANSMINELKTNISLNAGQVSFITETTEKIKTALNGNIEEVAKLKEWVNIKGDTLELGNSGSNFKAILSPTELGFWQGNTKVAWISNNSFKTAMGIITEYLQVGNWVFRDEGSAGLTIRRL